MSLEESKRLAFRRLLVTIESNEAKRKTMNACLLNLQRRPETKHTKRRIQDIEKVLNELEATKEAAMGAVGEFYANNQSLADAWFAEFDEDQQALKEEKEEEVFQGPHKFTPRYVV